MGEKLWTHLRRGGLLLMLRVRGLLRVRGRRLDGLSGEDRAAARARGGLRLLRGSGHRDYRASRPGTLAIASDGSFAKGAP